MSGPAASSRCASDRTPPKGTTFLTIEDETGCVNVIVWKSVHEQQREALLKSRLLAVDGVWQRDTDSGGQVCNLIARRLCKT